MTVITDIPQSGIYLQEGATTQLVVQIVDFSTGDPIQLQTASQLKISIQYPDGTYQQFNAQLYTDGSDGRIAYTTVNNGPLSMDLDQIGLYQIQGQAMIGAQVLPPSNLSDFYVLPNIGPTPTVNIYPAFILTDSNSVRWSIIVLPVGGNLDSIVTPSGPAGAYDVTPFVMRDNVGNFWQLVILPSGDLDTIPVQNPTSWVSSLLLSDSTGVVWTLTVLPPGNLDTNASIVLTPSSSKGSALIIFDSNATRWAVSVTIGGALISARTSFGPANALQFNNLVMVDSNGIFWSMQISTTGVFQGVQVGQTSGALNSFLLVDGNGKTWVITVDTSGNPIAS